MADRYYISNDVDLHYYEYGVSLWSENCDFKFIDSWKRNGLTLGVF